MGTLPRPQHSVAAAGATDIRSAAAAHVFFRARDRRHQHTERRVRLSATALAAVQFLATSLESIQLGSSKTSQQPRGSSGRVRELRHRSTVGTRNNQAGDRLWPPKSEPLFKLLKARIAL